MTRLMLVLLLALAGCHDRRPPAPSPEEEARLNEADALLNEMARNEALR